MTEKELMYIEDIIEHEKDLESICNYYINEVQDNELKDLLDLVANFQKQNYKELYGLLSK